MFLLVQGWFSENIGTRLGWGAPGLGSWLGRLGRAICWGVVSFPLTGGLEPGGLLVEENRAFKKKKHNPKPQFKGYVRLVGRLHLGFSRLLLGFE